MRPTGLAALAAAAADWSWVLRQQARAVVERGRADEFQQAPRGAPASCAEVPVVLLPGIWEPWQFLRPLATVLHAGGHPVHVVTELGWNGRDLDASADDVIAHLAAHDLRRVVLVAHSKGGLIGKKVLLHPRVDGRVTGLVALCAPFGGSSLSFGALARTPLGLFSPTGQAIAALAAETAVNRSIVSIASAWDEMIPEGSCLPGARNVTLDVVGHFRPVSDAGVHRLIHAEVDALASGEGEPCR